jgi:hypothetical protein
LINFSFMNHRIFLFGILLFLSCSSEEPAPTTTTTTTYFPQEGSVWERSTPSSIGWDETKLEDLRTFLSSTNSRALIVLKDGKIVIEEYMGKQLVNTNQDFFATSNWYWASAGKTLTLSCSWHCAVTGENKS